MRGRVEGSSRAERGFAMVLVMLITVIMTLLGVSFLLMAETENRIAENERLSSQVLFFAESAVRLTESWFNSAYLGDSLVIPPPAACDLSLREIDDDGDPATPPHPQDGSTWPRYKQGVDLDADGQDDLFRRPYRGDLLHALMGTPDGPDIRIDANASSSASVFLEDLSDKLIPGYPGGGAGLKARVSRIDIYAPPYIDLAGSWTRYGMATIRVDAEIVKQAGTVEQVLARRTVRAVVHEVPYYLPRAPLQSGRHAVFDGPLDVHWGPLTSVSTGDLDADLNNLPESHPREQPVGINVDLLWGYNDDALFSAYKGVIDGLAVEDPWFRYFSGGPLAGAPNSNTQPYPPPSWNPPDPATYPLPGSGDHSNLFQNMTTVPFTEFDYDFWKRLATSRNSRTHYYVWVEGSSFSENGYGPERTFRDITDNQEGIFFFDTKDKARPYDENGDGVFDNLTPEIVIDGGTWGTRGLIFLNAERFQVKNVTGRSITMNAPGEPFQDKNLNGSWDMGENWINLAYPWTLTDPIVADAADTMQDDGTAGVLAVRNRLGPDVPASAALWGILYTSGTFDASGTGRFYGAVMARTGVVQTEPAAGSPSLYWDDRLPTDWPPPTWHIPRVAVANWDSD